MKIREFTKDEIHSIYNDLYIGEGLGLRRVSKLLGIGENRLRRLFLENSLMIKKDGQRTGIQIPKMNEDIFKVWTKEMAYWSGFLAADGSVNKNKDSIYFKLIKEDRQQLQKFLDYLDTKDIQVKDYKMKYQNGVRDMSYVLVPNSEIKKDLMNIGIVPRKSYLDIDFLSFVPKEFKIYFIIGYFDGDGGISSVKQNNRFVISFTGNKVFLQTIIEFMIRNYDFNKVKVTNLNSNRYPMVSWGSKKDLKTFRNLYLTMLDNKLMLDRKLIIFKSKEFSEYVNR